MVKDNDPLKLLANVEWVELQRKQIEEQERKKIENQKLEEVEEKEEIQPEISCLENSNEENNGLLAEKIILEKRSTRNMFYDCEEYREDIYEYLLEHEVSIFLCKCGKIAEFDRKITLRFLQISI